ncbi:dTDP-4-dehydrorhamnose reductase [Halolamina pelagica]|uniref:dTDP-4-dehydrorhamnose reductase n=2 Tax=Halolamina pelagica TaxID=699431 RepID=A0A0P7HF50_9EURY|nr:dTDP-4-dehydrorhamnose reductase [Halolamina pelagica]KPN32334.1 dTDP-4-dehydrorhamnose reductase [Halolamina pelagica]
MRLLVVGANGLLGSNVVHTAQQRGWDVRGTYHSERPAFDIPLDQHGLRNYDVFRNILAEHEPEAVINCAAMTDVDACETNPELAYELNGEAPGEMAAECRRENIEFVHISTDYVFDGTARVPYDETDEMNPVQAYGESKLAGEQAVEEVQESALIARLSFVWGVHRGDEELTGFPAWVRGKFLDGDDVPLFIDQWVTPTRAGQAADVLLDLAAQGADGLFHVACRSCVTPYEFGELLSEYVDEDADLREGSVADVEREATRPTYSCLNVARLESTLNREQPTLREDIEAIEEAFR